MPKSISPKRIIALLKRKGFLLKRTKGSHHIFQHPATKRRVIVSLHHKDIPKGTLKEILEQARLSRDEL